MTPSQTPQTHPVASYSATARGVVSTLAVAILCNACCWLPPLLLAFGGFGARFAEFLEPYRPYLLALMAIQILWGFRNAYRSHAKCCGEDDKSQRRIRIVTMWIVAILVIALNLVGHDDKHELTARTIPLSSRQL